jgi:hypothetical protein
VIVRGTGEGQSCTSEHSSDCEEKGQVSFHC